MPRRAAAQKASQLAAAQLESSPPPSDRALNCGESSKSTTPIKGAYGRKGKGLITPERPLAAAPAKGGNARKRARPDPSVLDSSPSIRRALQSGSGADVSSPIVLSETEEEELPSPFRRRPSSSKAPPRRSPPAKKPASTMPRPGKAKSTSSNDLKHTGERAISISSDSDTDGSALTPLSSPTVPLSRTRTMSSLASLASSSHQRLWHGLNKVDSVASLADSNIGDNEPWSLSALGTLVWVSVDMSGEIANSEGHQYGGDTFWWPAKVTYSQDPVRVSLFGGGPGELKALEKGDLIIESPSALNILPMVMRGRIRFTERNYRNHAGATDVQASPRKRRRVEIDMRWKDARNTMLQEDEEDNEGLPMLLSNYFSREPTFPVQAPSVADSKTSEDIAVSDDASHAKPRKKAWRPPSCDPALEIPGELVLAKERRAYTDYWPARLLEYIPPVNPRQRPRYKAEFYDNTVKNIDADWFCTIDDENFKSCKLGQDAYNYDMEEDHDNLATSPANDLRDLEIPDDYVLRVLTPTPPIPPPGDFEEDLSLAEQFEYVKPVLAAVIEGQFEPANERHDQFMRGAAARRAVCESGYTRGTLKQDEVEGLLLLVRGWALRRERRREIGFLLNDTDMRPCVTDISRSMHEGARAGGNQDSSQHEYVAEVLTPVRLPVESQAETSTLQADAPPSCLMAAGADADAVVHENKASALNNTTHATDSVNRPGGPDTDVACSPGRIAVANEHSDPELSYSGAERRPVVGGVGRARPKTAFKDLSDIDQITYCQNILLHEAVLQLLLWRSGERVTLKILSQDEERRLHVLAFDKANESDWVHEIIRLKQAAEGNLLPWAEDDRRKMVSVNPLLSAGGTRSRPKKGSS